MEELSDAAKQMAFTDDLEKTQEERLNMFYKFVEVRKFLYEHRERGAFIFKRSCIISNTF